jgi:hypothetical protein
MLLFSLLATAEQYIRVSSGKRGSWLMFGTLL